MKKLLILICIIKSVFVYSQNTNIVFTSDSIVYYGLDLSNSRLIGDFGKGDGYSMKTKLFVKWNNVITNERSKFDLKKTFHKSSVYYDLKPVTIQNSKTNEALILTPNEDHFINSQLIQSMVGSYKDGDRPAGVGLVFIVESFNKTLKLATVYVTFFDIASKKVLFSEKVNAEPNGIGLRNYWANSIHEILKHIHQKKYEQWKKKYSSN